MPGIENFAPDRTETSSGFETSTELLARGLLELPQVVFDLTLDARRGCGRVPRSHRLQTPVEIVKPGGTGRPAFDISASPDPLPPSTSFIVRSPSALPAPKKNTFFFARAGLSAAPPPL